MISIHLIKHPKGLRLNCYIPSFSRRSSAALDRKGVWWQVCHLLTVSCSKFTPQLTHLLSLSLSLSTSVSSFPVDGQNQCLKAAQDCGLFEKCGALRAEYVLACTKRVTGSDRCNRQKCHRALRKFLERVPEEYSFGVLFCSCTEPLCGERRRKTIVPSCSYEEKDGQPNCLHLESYCLRDDLCRWVYVYKHIIHGSSL